MRISSIGLNQPPPSVQKPGMTSGTSFGDTIKSAVDKVNEMQNNADQLANKLASGDSVEIHQAMIAMSKAGTALQFTAQVRNKVIEAYQEIMRTQV